VLVRPWLYTVMVDSLYTASRNVYTVCIV
jgi:hypothetical protein